MSQVDKKGYGMPFSTRPFCYGNPIQGYIGGKEKVKGFLLLIVWVSPLSD